MNQKNPHIGLNHQRDYFTCTTSTGFAVYCVDPLTKVLDRPWNEPIMLIEILNRTNIFAIVVVARPKNILLWDDAKSAVFCEHECLTPIAQVSLLDATIIISTETDLKILSIEAAPRMLYQISLPCASSILQCGYSGSDLVVALGTRQAGSLRIVRLSHLREGVIAAAVHVIKAHTMALQYITMSSCATKLATTSTSGMLVKVWCTQTCSLLAELRRGRRKARIRVLQFGAEDNSLLVASESRTIHIFTQEESQMSNMQLVASGDPALPLMCSRWSSHLKARLPQEWDELELDAHLFLTWSTYRVFCVFSSLGRYMKFVLPRDSRNGESAVECLLEAQRSITVV